MTLPCETLRAEPASQEERKALFMPYKGELKMWPVVRERIGNVRNKAAEVAEAISAGT